MVRDDDGHIECMPLIQCLLVEGLSVGVDSKIPDNCLYNLEHTLLKKETVILYESWLSEFNERKKMIDEIREETDED